MSLMSKILPRKQKEEVASNPLAEYFLGQIDSPDFPFNLALNAYEDLEQSAQSKEDFFHYLLEDAIFTSLYATFFEQLLTTIRENPSLALSLIEGFENSSKEREQIIGEQTEHHFNFILQKGLCPGCPACENHNDVSELIKPYLKGDIEFFANLYIGMQSIHYAMEQLIYEVLPARPSLVQHLSHQNILGLRKTVYDYAEANL